MNQQAVQMDFNPEFITRIIPRLDWAAIYAGAEKVSRQTVHMSSTRLTIVLMSLLQVGCRNDLPAELTEQLQTDNEFLQKLHHILLEIDIVEGNLECPETGRLFPITDGIPNMLLNEDEV